MTSRVVVLPAAIALTLAGAGCSGLAGRADPTPLSLSGGAVTMTPPRGFEVAVQPQRVGSQTEVVEFRGSARRRGSFNNCSVSSVRVSPEARNGLGLGAFVAGVARDRLAVQQATAGLHDVSLVEPLPGQASDPYVVHWSFTIDYRLRTAERFWGMPSAQGDFLITQSCHTGGPAEELADILKATSPIAD